MTNPEQHVTAAQAVLAERVAACGPCMRTLGLASLDGAADDRLASAPGAAAAA